ncbi:C40 family peptidase [Neobacillus vireti]|uniref:C40 family peptidase n=1 Tax=Neobacillus vireti TaxID=220686 RepID=UPI002FFF85C9
MKKTIVRAVSTAAFLSVVYAGSAYASTHTVQKGDTLSEIAVKYQTSVSELKSLNGLKSDLIFVNQTLKVSAAAQLAKPAASTPAPAATATNVYVVKSGDYLGKIAKQFATSVKELKDLNGLKSDMIYAGQTLKVSGKVETPTPPPAAVTPPPANVSSTTVYSVVSGDTLSKIGVQYKMTVQELKQLNGLNSDMIYVGQKLKVSGKASVTTPPPAPTTPVKPPAESSSDFQTEFVSVAKSLMGIPYLWAGSSLSGFDCSGFIYYAANKAGYKIGRYSAAGYYSRTFYVDQPQPGDLVFFENTYKKGISHLGIYIGNNEFIHADEKNGVSIANLSNPYYTKHFDGFKRFY